MTPSDSVRSTFPWCRPPCARSVSVAVRCWRSSTWTRMSAFRAACSLSARWVGVLPERPALMHSAAASTRGIRWMTLAMSVFMVNDAIVKTLSVSLPVGQLVLVRGLFAVAFVALVSRGAMLRAAAGAPGPIWTRRTIGLVILRGVLEGIATLAYIVSLFHLPLPSAASINMAAPLFLTVIAATWLKTPVNPMGWLATMTGFAGVLLIIQPSADSFNAWGWLCLTSTVVQAVRDLMTQRIPPDVPSQAITLVVAMSVTAGGAFIGMWQDFQPLTIQAVALMAGAGLCIAIGYYCLVMATRVGDPTVVAPFRYSGLLLALVLGWLMWDDVPNTMAWLGIALLLSAGAYLLRTVRPQAGTSVR
ncbi:MAG: DMT family transporter [Rhodoferax sp.]|nr:DMT family transporter [Rhodoferax sp.]